MSRQGIHAFLGNISYGVDPVPGMECLALLGVNQDGTVHILHSFFDVPVGRYSAERRLLAFSGELPTGGLPPVTELLVASFAVWHAICAVPREGHFVHVVGISPSRCQTTPCERLGKHTDTKYLVCQGLTFFPPDDASHLLVLGSNISEASCLLFPLISS